MNNSLSVHLTSAKGQGRDVKDVGDVARRSPLLPRPTDKTFTASEPRLAESRKKSRSGGNLGILGLRNDYTDPLSKDDELQIMKEAWKSNKSPSGREIRHLSSITQRSYKTVRAWFEKHAPLADDNDAVDVELQHALDDFDFLDSSSEEEDGDPDSDSDDDLATPQNNLRPLPRLPKGTISAARNSPHVAHLSQESSSVFSSQESHHVMSSGGPRSVKSSRKVMSGEKKARLESYFESDPMPSMSARQALADELQLEIKSVSQWFAMKRFRTRQTVSTVLPTTPALVLPKPAQESTKASNERSQPVRRSRRVRIASTTPSVPDLHEEARSKQPMFASSPLESKGRARHPRIFFPCPDLTEVELPPISTEMDPNDSNGSPATSTVAMSLTLETRSQHHPALANNSHITPIEIRSERLLLTPTRVPSQHASISTSTPARPVTRDTPLVLRKSLAVSLVGEGTSSTISLHDPDGRVVHPESCLRTPVSHPPLEDRSELAVSDGVAPRKPRQLSAQHPTTSHALSSGAKSQATLTSSSHTPLPSFQTFLFRTAARPYVSPSTNAPQSTSRPSHPHAFRHHSVYRRARVSPS